MKDRTDVTRQQLRSSKGHKKVRFGQTTVTTDTSPPDGKTRDTGLDLSLFEGHVDTDLICRICHRVFVQPELSACQHVFCSKCLHRFITKECPTCKAPLGRTPSQQPTVQLRLKLLELNIHCDHKCGQVLPLGKLPEHVSHECPNTPVSCQYTKKGCKMHVKRCELEKHMNECGWRPVECDACGEKTVYNNLHLHQKKSRCVENRIRNQLVHAIKSTSQEVRNHRRTLEHQRVQIDKQQRRNEIDHVKRQQSLKLQQQRQGILNSQQTHMSLYKEPSNVSKPHSNGHNTEDTDRQRRNISIHFPPKFGSVPITTQSRNDNNAMTSHSRPGSQQIVERKHTIPIGGGSNGKSNNVFVTNTEELDITDSDANDGSSVPASRGQQLDGVFICRKCNRRVRELNNKPTSCRWHVGPIIELFGGTCYTCGRLDYQHGCMVGYHEM